mgnify:CR=1 FL=1
MSEIAIPFPFTTYGTKKGGLNVGQVYRDMDSGKAFRFCQCDTSIVGTVLVATATQFDPVVPVGSTTWGLATDDISDGLDATHPFCLGVPTSACPVSTSTITYYFWAQVEGWLHTVSAGAFTTTKGAIKMNTDDDAAIGHTIILTANDAAADTVATGTAGVTQKAVGYVMVAVVAATDLVPGVWINTGLR